jgi:glycosyltransferase involved in cell wall biosynthesis
MISNTLKNRVIIIGPIFKNDKDYVGEGAKLYYQLQSEGYDVRVKSHIKNKLLRFLDILFFSVFSTQKGDVVLLQSYGLLAFYMEDAVSRICKIKGIPIVFTLHGGAFGEFYQKNKSWVSSTLKRATLITTPSLYLKDQLSELNLKIIHIPNFINLDKFSYTSSSKTEYSILWIRGFHEIYHPELAIEVVEKLKSNFPNIKLTMVGKDQGSKERCINMAIQNNLTLNISFPGYINNNELITFYNSHEVFLNTTHYESFGVSLIEAAACGIPIVSIKVGEIPYIWKHQQDILLSERDPDKIAEAITSLFNNKELYHRIAKAAMGKAQQYTWNNIGPKWNNILAEITTTCAE